MKKLILILPIFLLGSSSDLKDVSVDKNIYQVTYSQKLEQPLTLTYQSTNRPTNVNRGSMDFYEESGIKTSDGKDYVSNIYDKGHLAPAATFSDNKENLKITFSYLNCALQDQYLNRGEWRLLEEQERKWDDKENLTVKIDVLFDKNSKVLPTGATVPSGFVKHIYFGKQKTWMCFRFPNVKATKPWEEHKVYCKH
jgi:endonuclease G